MITEEQIRKLMPQIAWGVRPDHDQVVMGIAKETIKRYQTFATPFAGGNKP